ncbi:MAG TPA: type 2 lanthipeptide synthetase LanM family protein [Xanthobacteraceae bacterium]|nr:type 2 lanthipeptide synthetase LanM family protein [Xanthobacteraceae bacterium]
MDAFYERLLVRAATLDEVLSDDFEPLPGQKGDADLAARRLAAWCRACASGDWSLFDRRLERDGLAFASVLARLAAVRRSASAAAPSWLDDAIWIEAALHDSGGNTTPLAASDNTEPCAFEQLFMAVVAQADGLLWSGLDARVADNLNEAARGSLRRALLRELSSLGTPALYERFAKARNASSPQHDAIAPARRNGSARYDHFVAEMQAGGWRRLFEDKPVLLRLFATVTRQWIDTSRELVLRLDADLAVIRRDILHSANTGRVAAIEGNLSDPHNQGRSVRIVSFEDGARVVYKPKDLRLDAAWHALVERLNGAYAPIALKAVRAIARDGFGWTEFIDHSGCADDEGFARFFRRAGGWLALFHCFAATDMHQENMIACGDHPVPIDLEMILQAGVEERSAEAPEDLAFDAAAEIVGNSVMAVGLLPAYGRSPDNKVFAIGGMTADWNSRTEIVWDNINSDAMRPAKSREAATTSPNLPHVGGRNAKFGDHIDDFVAGFEQYAKFLLRHGREQGELFDGFAGVPIRKVIRATRFYYMLLQRLRNHKAMDDGVTWAAQADFIARLADWQSERNPLWPLQRAERSALLVLNVPHFVSPSDGHDIGDAHGHSIHTEAPSGLDRARARMRNFDEREIAWQIEVIRENTNSVSRSVRPKAELQETPRQDAAIAPTKEIFIAEADRIAAELSRYAIRRGPGAAWIGLDWLGDAEVSQLVCLGPDLYNGICGIGVFLAAHAAVTGNKASAELARAGLTQLRKNLKGRNAARIARSLGVGGAVGLGSIVYALAVMAKCLNDDALLADARGAVALFTDDLIAADKQLDVIGGSAGAILGLLRLHRDSRSDAALRRAVKCGEHLLGEPRLGPEGRRIWVGQGSGPRGLNGMSHGAAGFAYALMSLAQATGRQEFAQAAGECIAFENASYDAGQHNWPDLREEGRPSWPCQWCHGAVGIGLARLATGRLRGTDDAPLTADIQNAVDGARQGRPIAVDTLCCGALGGVEFFCEAGAALGRDDLSALAAERLTAVLRRAAAAGDYRWNSGKGRFNLGLFRGLAGVGYTLLRRVDGALPNVIIWE